MRGSGFWQRRSRRRAADASLLQRLVADTIDGAVLTAVPDAVRRASGAPSLWPSDGGDAERWGRRDWAVLLTVTAASVAGDLLLDGRTPGRAAAGIRLERDSGERLDVRTAVIREYAPYVTNFAMRRSVRVLARGSAGRMAAGVAAWSLATLAAQAADPHHRLLEDLIAGTRMVRSPERRR